MKGVTRGGEPTNKNVKIETHYSCPTLCPSQQAAVSGGDQNRARTRSVICWTLSGGQKHKSNLMVMLLCFCRDNVRETIKTALVLALESTNNRHPAGGCVM